MWQPATQQAQPEQPQQPQKQQKQQPETQRAQQEQPAVQQSVQQPGLGPPRPVPCPCCTLCFKGRPLEQPQQQPTALHQKAAFLPRLLPAIAAGLAPNPAECPPRPWVPAAKHWHLQAAWQHRAQALPSAAARGNAHHPQPSVHGCPPVQGCLEQSASCRPESPTPSWTYRCCTAAEARALKEPISEHDQLIACSS